MSVRNLAVVATTMLSIVMGMTWVTRTRTAQGAFVATHLPDSAWSGSSDDLDQRATQLLTDRCGQCHASTARDIKGDFGIVDNPAKMRGDPYYLVPGDPDNSLILARVESGEMPPRKPLSEEETQLLRDWIQNGAKIPSSDPEVPVQRRVISYQETTEAVLQDLRSIPRHKRSKARYFTTTNLHNNVELSQAELNLYQAALRKMLNSLTWSNRLTTPTPIDADETIYRVFLTDLDWEDAIWDRLIEVYPYAIELDSEDWEEIKTLSRTPIAMLRADWFVFAASQEPLYSEVLKLPSGRNALEDLERLLAVDRLTSINELTPLRAGFQRSGVSSNNRVIERHESKYGGYWISYDFGGNTDKQNIFSRPLGPSQSGLDEQYRFNHDGGEVIFSLPNGMQAYMLVDGNGASLQTGPPNIVFDRTQRRSAMIVNAVSCISCHVNGMQPAQDEVRSRIAGLGARFPRRSREQVEALYVEDREFQVAIAEDRERFQEAVRSIRAHDFVDEPVRALFERFLRPLSTVSVAADIGVGPQDLELAMRHNPDLTSLRQRLAGQGVPRDVFIADFRSLVHEFNLGSVRESRPIAFPIFSGGGGSTSAERGDVESASESSPTSIPEGATSERVAWSDGRYEGVAEWRDPNGGVHKRSLAITVAGGQPSELSDNFSRVLEVDSERESWQHVWNLEILALASNMASVTLDDDLAVFEGRREPRRNQGQVGTIRDYRVIADVEFKDRCSVVFSVVSSSGQFVALPTYKMERRGNAIVVTTEGMTLDSLTSFVPVVPNRPSTLMSIRAEFVGN